MRQLVPLLLLAPILLAGCAGEKEERSLRDAGRPAETRGPDDYWMIWAHGTETLKAPDGARPARGIHPAFEHSFSTDRWLTLNAGTLQDPSEVRHVVAFDLHAEDGSALLYQHRVNSAALTAYFGRLGAVEIDVREDGALVVDGQEVPQGKKLVVSYVRKGEPGQSYHGEVTFENLGAWPRGQIEIQPWR